MRCSDGQLSWREQGHRREPGQVDSFFLGRVREEGPSERNVRAIGVAWGKARDKTTGLRLDLVQRELHGRQVGPREMRGQVFRRGEQRRQVRAGSHGRQNKRLVTRRAVTPMDPLPTCDPTWTRPWTRPPSSASLLSRFPPPHPSRTSPTTSTAPSALPSSSTTAPPPSAGASPPPRPPT